MMNCCTLRTLLTLGTICALAVGAFPLHADDKPVLAIAVGDKLPNKNSLRDLRGNRRPLQDFKDHRALVLAFLAPSAPFQSCTSPACSSWRKSIGAKMLNFSPFTPTSMMPRSRRRA